MNTVTKTIIMLLVIISIQSSAMATAGTVSIWGTNASNAQQNVTISGAPAAVTVTAWSVGGIKTFTVQVKNASDAITFTLYNVTAGQVNELKVNGTPINGYQANDTGVITFIRTQGGIANHTFNIQPAINQGGYNSTWSYNQFVRVTSELNASTVINLTYYFGQSKLLLDNVKIAMQLYHAAAIPAPGIRIYSSRGTLSAPTTLLSGDVLWFITGMGFGATGYSATGRSQITSYVTENWTDTAQGTELVFETTPRGSVARDHMWNVSSSGNLTSLKAGNGISLKSANGSYYCVTVTDAGTLQATAGICLT